LYGWESGIIVKLSVFSGNNIDIIMHGANPSHRFEFIGCLFSAASLPAGCFDGSTWGNAFQAAPQSLSLPNLPRQACKAQTVPDATPTESASFYFTMPGYQPRRHRSMLISTACFLWLRF
jgi:hypothetical protein